jgi:Replication-relaxation
LHKKVDTGRRASVADQLARLAGRLTDRDRAIVHLIGEHRVFTTGQLAAVFFGSQDRAEHRLRQLTDAQVLARFRPRTRHGEGSAPYHYVLGPLGAAVLAAEEETDMNRVVYRQDKALAVAHSQHLAHLVGVNGVFATLIRVRPPRASSGRHKGGPGGPGGVVRSERRCADHWGRLVRPDGYGRWREGDREVEFFLEYDRGTEPLERLTGKLHAYSQLAHATRATPMLFWLPTAGREATVRQALTNQTRWAAVPFPIATGNRALDRGPAEQAWLPIGHTWPRRRLIDLTNVDQSSDKVPPSSVRS